MDGQRAAGSGADFAGLADAGGHVLASRAYQLEMFEASLQGNTIVVMDTGSGKTQVAILRIRHELEHRHDQKLIWFLAPTVALCSQQFDVLCASFPSTPVRLLVGSDNVDRWASPSIWNTVLDSHTIIVSTYAILSDALFHGFVSMQRLGLLIFDEAHHCVGEHPANKIMKDHYYSWSRRCGSDAVPGILGLTASPVMKSKVDPASLRLIERKLNAISKTPRVHRDELRRFVHLPALIHLDYDIEADPEGPGALDGLLETCENIDIWQDPYVLKLTADGATSAHEVNGVAVSRKTHSQEELRRFYGKASHINSELGLWAVKRYIHSSVEKLRTALTSEGNVLYGWKEDEKAFVYNVLSRKLTLGRASPRSRDLPLVVSAKVEKLIGFLGAQRDRQFSGIIFVKQRATAVMLHQLLMAHPETKHLSCATFVGTSNSSSRKASIGDLVDVSQQSQVLDDFRLGKRDLIIATSVLEEGIDVSSCNLVVCFNKPDNLKSFIQRRGRARDSQSVFVMMLSREDTLLRGRKWQELEETMIQTFQEERGKQQEILHREEVPEPGQRRFEIESTGAVLTLETARTHLYHFCSVLPRYEFVDHRPVFRYHEDPITQLLKAEVVLSNAMDASVRRASSAERWRTERQANKDAAFQAYISLYHAGLVNDNLLPAPKLGQKLRFGIERMASRVPVADRYDPWPSLAQAWNNHTTKVYATAITIERPGREQLLMFLLLPEELPVLPSCALFLNATDTYTASFSGTHVDGLQPDKVSVTTAQVISCVILRSVYSRKMLEGRADIATPFVPCLENTRLQTWMTANDGTVSAAEAFEQRRTSYGLVRNPSLYGSPQLFQAWGADGTLEVTPLPRRRDFLHHYNPVQAQGSLEQQNLTRTRTRLLPLERTTFDRLSLDNVKFALLVPSIIHHIEKSLIAAHLSRTILSSVCFCDLSIVVEAISASSANECNNYQRLEFVGDVTLKFVVATQLFTTHSNWHEGYLSQAKDSIVANHRLARAALDKGLDRYILSKPFAARRWTPRYLLEPRQPQASAEQTLSTKVIADVLEALIGAALVDGGLAKAVQCAHDFLPEIDAQTPEEVLRNHEYYRSQSADVVPQHHHLSELQRLLGYEFSEPRLLVEAMTHPSLSTDFSTTSYQRLEFLGDAVIDMLVTTRLVSHSPNLSHVSMHLVKSALVNANFLAFLCMEFSLSQHMQDVREDTTSAKLAAVSFQRTVRLCDFIRHGQAELARARQACVERYRRLRDEIRNAIHNGRTHPWSMLARLEAPKFFSDIVESLFGATFVDSCGNLSLCEELAERIGLTPYLIRILRESVDVLHPKSRLGELANGKVTYVMKREEAPKQGLYCTVCVGGVQVAKVTEGTSREEVTTRAAEAAVRIISAGESSLAQE